MSDLYSNPFPDFREFIEGGMSSEADINPLSCFNEFADEAAGRHDLERNFKAFWNIPDEEEEPEPEDNGDNGDNDDESDEEEEDDSPLKIEADDDDNSDDPDKVDDDEQPQQADNDGDLDDPQKAPDNTDTADQADDGEVSDIEDQSDKIEKPETPTGDEGGHEKISQGSDSGDNAEGHDSDGEGKSSDSGGEDDSQDIGEESDDGEPAEMSDDGPPVAGSEESSEEAETLSGNTTGESDGGDSVDSDNEYDNQDETQNVQGTASPTDGGKEEYDSSGNHKTADMSDEEVKAWEEENKVSSSLVDDRKWHSAEGLANQAKYLDQISSKTEEGWSYEDSTSPALQPNEGNVQMLVNALSKFQTKSHKKLGFSGKLNVNEFIKNKIKRMDGDLPSLKIFDVPQIEQRLRLVVMIDGSGSFLPHRTHIKQICADLFECQKRLDLEIEIWQGNTRYRYFSFSAGRWKNIQREDVGMMNRIEKSGIPDIDCRSGTAISHWLHFIADRCEKMDSDRTTIVLTIVDGADPANYSVEKNGRQVVANSDYQNGLHTQKAINRIRRTGAHAFTCLWSPAKEFIGSIAEFYKPNYYNVSDSSEWYELTSKYLSREAEKI